ncbi:class IV adenylate cyclase [Candidatus Saccharibacteria bacterium]|nr:class IV adenylate cyclase [Candidatus Saccharibacteria bacterium]MBH1972911.1 class IV adenylate cyclase [Candidatus Saccharibacteria bacterium]MBH1991113.1 class IV adenylate cyclase [Candidatus Saccharibacteria bacterium]OGL23120.1 MAG: hypothetical protein A2791_05585 [Candidatus Saccharibacteria bacterium RIFCSPHIGHO2_01_FULL_46_30]
MREIEVKARLKDMTLVIDRLTGAEVTVSDPVTQRDQVFGLIGQDGSGDNQHPWLRLRTETKNNTTIHIFTLKKSVTSQLDSIEHETIVDDPAELVQIIAQLGFEAYSDLTKTRRKAKIGSIELCLDTVEGLGNFIEAEQLTDDTADYDTISQGLWRLLEKYGVSRVDEVTDGYDTLERRQRGLE